MPDSKTEWTLCGTALPRIEAIERLQRAMECSPATLFPANHSMWRALFLAVGIFLCILGAQCLVVDRFVMASDQPLPGEETPATLFGAPPSGPMATRDIEPADWAPWSFLSGGAVVILYALTINKP